MRPSVFTSLYPKTFSEVEILKNSESPLQTTCLLVDEIDLFIPRQTSIALNDGRRTLLAVILFSFTDEQFMLRSRVVDKHNSCVWILVSVNRFISRVFSMPLFWETIIEDVTRLRIGGKVLPLVTFLAANDDCSIILETLTRHSIPFPSSRKKELSVLFVLLGNVCYLLATNTI